ncbi:hypothetical protein E6Q11_06960 [Candidatus Dojkabacteria bacterium]|uniref:Uncharacterized protein n=1 Tax=Candidatus Dojkabacteria bacterium TaxID=2099670 RepID=A0A5C7J2G9_9BACT|nr:MAG: hypothetical protein E6Q11_06960 [Candidatus Dojkabacteria bacterium]
MKIKIPKLLKRSFFTKRERFAAGVLIISSLLFITEHFLTRSELIVVLGLSFLTDVFLYWALRNDLKNNFSPQVFILPFFYTMAFGFFYLLVPQRLLAELVLTIIFAIGLYSLYLSQNIFIVSSIRTIALLSGARTVSFVITILTYLFLTTIVYSLRLNIFVVLPLILFYSFFLTMQAIWSGTLEKSPRKNLLYVSLITICQLQIAALLWFWPNTTWVLSSFDPPPVLISLFLTGFFYIVIGLSHLWFEKRLFKSTLWEYVWVGFFVFVMLVAFTSWS